jgi:hypothetical protein
MRTLAGALALLLVAPVHAINLNPSVADAERALAIARDREAGRARFHASYITRPGDPFLESIEIVTEYRRIVLLAEERARRGDYLFSYSSRSVLNALEPWRDRVSVIARVRFHPLNTYVALPRIDMSIDGAQGDQARVGVLKEPIVPIGLTPPGEHVPLLGAVVEGVFVASLIGQTDRVVSIGVDGKEVARVRLGFAAVE